MKALDNYKDTHPTVLALFRDLRIALLLPDEPWAAASYTPGPDYIWAQAKDHPCYLALTQEYALLHELIHWTGHKKRLRRKVIMGGPLAATDAEFHTEEYAAELGAVLLMDALQIPCLIPPSVIFHSYVRRLPSADVRAAEEMAYKAVCYLKLQAPEAFLPKPTQAHISSRLIHGLSAEAA